MLTIGFTLTIVLVSYGLLGVFAVIVGHVMSMLLRLRWSGHSAAADAALAVSVAIACVVTMALLYPELSYGVIWIGLLSLLSVVLRYLGRFVARTFQDSDSATRIDHGLDKDSRRSSEHDD